MAEATPLDPAALYRVLAESAQDAIVTIDERSTVLSVNPAAERLFARPAAEILGRSLTHLMPERYRAGHEHGLKRYRESGVRSIPWRGVQVPILTADGREIPVEISFGEFMAGTQRVFSAMMRDISDRVETQAVLAANLEQMQTQATELEQQVEEAQAVSEELEQTNEELDAARQRVEDILNSLTDAVSVFDDNWHWTFLNPRAAAILASMGKDPKEMMGKKLWDGLPELVGTRFEHETRRAMQAHEAVQYEEYLPSVGRWFEIRAVPSDAGLTTFTRDITEQRIAADILRRREAEFRALANSIPTLAWMANADGWIFWYNERWYEYTGTVAADMEGWGWQAVHDPKVLPAVLEQWTASIRTAQPFEMTFPLRAADGSFRPFLTRVFPLRDDDGGVVRWFGTNTDIQTEYDARAAAEQSRERMEQLQTLTALLAAARTVEDVAAVVIGEAAKATGAATGMLAVRAAGAEEAIMIGESGLPASLKSDYLRFPLDRDTPSAEVIRTATPIFIGHREGNDGLLARYPLLVDVWDTVGRNALASIPLLSSQRAIGAMSFTYAEPQQFDADRREFLISLGAQAAQAIERVDAFEAERRERRRSESIVESITDGFATFDSQLRFTYVNARAAQMFGVDRIALLGRPIAELARAEESPFLALIRSVVATGREGALEGYGTILGRWLDMRAYHSEDGGVIVYFQDITERRRQQEGASFMAEASRLLASSPDYQTTLANLARVCIPRLGDWCAVDLLETEPGGAPRLHRVAIVHQDAAKLSLGEEYARRYPPDLTDTRASAMAQALNGESVLIPEITDDMLVAGVPDPEQLAMLRQLGLASVMVVPLRHAQSVLGAITFCVGTEGKRYEEADLRLAEDLANRAAIAVEHSRLLSRAESANAAKTEFLRTVSHELRQPLNAIGGLLQLWELGLRGDLSVQQQQDLERIKRNQYQLTTLIEDLLSFARIEAGQLSIKRVPVAVNDVLDELRTAVSFELESKGIAYECRLADPGLALMADADRLHQVLVNLVTNAVRATEAGGRIDIWSDADSNAVLLNVRDTGVGIPADKLDVIFNPFVQVDRALNRPREGAGLGLAISMELVTAMGGTITVESEIGVGSTFTVALARASVDSTTLSS